VLHICNGHNVAEAVVKLCCEQLHAAKTHSLIFPNPSMQQYELARPRGMYINNRIKQLKREVKASSLTTRLAVPVPSPMF